MLSKRDDHTSLHQQRLLLQKNSSPNSDHVHCLSRENLSWALLSWVNERKLTTDSMREVFKVLPLKSYQESDHESTISLAIIWIQNYHLLI